MTVRPEPAHDLDPSSSIWRRMLALGEAVSVRTPLVLVPSGADAHLDAAAGDDVDRGGNLGHIRRVPVRHARASLAEPDPSGRRGEAAISVQAS